jgi:predicted RNA-binding Zn ribbon-like protein
MVKRCSSAVLGEEGIAGAQVMSVRGGPLGVRLAAVLAEAAADLLASPAVTKIRECAADDCVLVFLPAHPRRRWCSATRCGNRVRVARYYERHKPDNAGRE